VEEIGEFRDLKGEFFREFDEKQENNKIKQ